MVLHVQPEVKYSNDEMRSFLDTLDASDRVEVTQWEGDFISDTLESKTFVGGQLTVIARMIESYGHRIEQWR